MLAALVALVVGVGGAQRQGWPKHDNKIQEEAEAEAEASRPNCFQTRHASDFHTAAASIITVFRILQLL